MGKAREDKEHRNKGGFKHRVTHKAAKLNKMETGEHFSTMYVSLSVLPMESP